jgi:hypothetical protein
MCGAGCGGNKAAVVTADTAASVATVGEDTTVYRVTYFNGTEEEVRGIEAVRQRVINPASRAPGTDENGKQGATYAPKR